MQAAHAVMVDYLNDFSFFAAFNGLCAFVMVNKNKLGFVRFQQAHLVNAFLTSSRSSLLLKETTLVVIKSLTGASSSWL